MPNPVVTTVELQEENITNAAFYFLGSVAKNGWTVTAWGFWYYKTSAGVGTQVYIASTSNFALNDFLKFSSGKLPNTSYTFRARVYAKKAIVESPYWEYIEVFGGWEEKTTHAYCYVEGIHVSNINKSIGEAYFNTVLEDNDSGNCVEVGFEYGISRTPGGSIVKSISGFVEDDQTRVKVTGLASNQDYYVRAYAKSTTEHIFYNGGMSSTDDNWLGGWRKFTTKILVAEIAIAEPGWYDDAGKSTEFLVTLDANGQEVNAYLMDGWDNGVGITVNADDNIIYGGGYFIGGSYSRRIGQMPIQAGTPDSYKVVTNYINGVFYHSDGFTYTLEYSGSGGSRVLYVKRRDGNTEIASLTLGNLMRYGLALDSEGNVYTLNTGTYSHHKIEKWSFLSSYKIFAIDTVNKKFTVEGIVDPALGEGITIAVANTDYNDGIYTIVSFEVIGNYTAFIVAEEIPSGTVEGYITKATGTGSLIASIEAGGSNPFTYGNVAITDDYVYAGAWFDRPRRANRELSFIEIWEPPGDWHTWIDGDRDFFYVAMYKGKVLVEGVPDGEGDFGEYNRAIALYEPDGTLIWQVVRNQGLDGMGGLPYYIPSAELINTKAESDSTQTAIRFYGEITSIYGEITEKGFEYLIQDEEPAPEATGIEVIKTKPSYIEFWEVGEYWAYEYEGNDVDFWDRLYNLEDDTIWWFRAICRDEEGNKYTAETWMKNVPSVTTFECTEVAAQQAKGNGEMTDKGANIVTRRGFRIIKEYVGDLFQAIPYEYDDFNCDNLESEELLSPEGVLIGFIWRGDLYRDALWPKSMTPGDFEIGIYENIMGGGMLEEGFGIFLKPNDTYKILAIAVNQHGTGFGEEVDLVTGQMILPSDPEEDEIVSEISEEKTITLGTIPDGCTVTRIGIRLGRTEGCTDMHVYEDGSWTSGGSHTFYITGFVPGSTYYKMPYIILNHGDYEEEIKAIPDYRNPERLEEWLTDYPIEVFPEVEDEDDLDQTVTDASVGDISYRTIIKDIRCEKIGEQSFIDMYGRRRSQTINNHLIQTHENCKTIAIEYVEKFQILKMKIAIDYDIPIPFEREDVILLGDGKHKYREDGQGLIAFKADGAGTILQQAFILAKIRKIDSNYISGTEVILSLELEV